MRYATFKCGVARDTHSERAAMDGGGGGRRTVRRLHTKTRTITITTITTNKQHRIGATVAWRARAQNHVARHGRRALTNGRQLNYAHAFARPCSRAAIRYRDCRRGRSPSGTVFNSPVNACTCAGALTHAHAWSGDDPAPAVCDADPVCALCAQSKSAPNAEPAVGTIHAGPPPLQ